MTVRRFAILVALLVSVVLSGFLWWVAVFVHSGGTGHAVATVTLWFATSVVGLIAYLCELHESEA